MAGRKQSQTRRPQRNRTSWDPLAEWYDGWVGKDGSKHHRYLAIPELLRLLAPQPEERILDIGAGQGVLAPHIAEAGASYTGVDLSPKLIDLTGSVMARSARFLKGDVRHLRSLSGIDGQSFEAVTFLLSIQDMDPLEEAIQAAAWALAEGGRMVILMTHPCFRIPRQSGWGWDPDRKLQYRRVDRYLTPLAVPMKPHSTGKRSSDDGGVSRSFHRPLSDYVNGLGANGLWVDSLEEIPAYTQGAPQAGKGSKRKKQQDKAEERANQEIPLFLALRAVKVG